MTDVFRRILKLDTDGTVKVTIYGNEMHHRRLENGQRFDMDFVVDFPNGTRINEPGKFDSRLPPDVDVSDEDSYCLRGKASKVHISRRLPSELTVTASRCR